MQRMLELHQRLQTKLEEVVCNPVSSDFSYFLAEMVELFGYFFHRVVFGEHGNCNCKRSESYVWCANGTVRSFHVRLREFLCTCRVILLSRPYHVRLRVLYCRCAKKYMVSCVFSWVVPLSGYISIVFARNVHDQWMPFLYCLLLVFDLCGNIYPSLLKSMHLWYVHMGGGVQSGAEYVFIVHDKIAWITLGLHILPLYGIRTEHLLKLCWLIWLTYKTKIKCWCYISL